MRSKRQIVETVANLIREPDKFVVDLSAINKLAGGRQNVLIDSINIIGILGIGSGRGEPGEIFQINSDKKEERFRSEITNFYKIALRDLDSKAQPQENNLD